MKRTITSLTSVLMTSSLNLTAYTAEKLDKDYIEYEIWSKKIHTVKKTYNAHRCLIY